MRAEKRCYDCCMKKAKGMVEGSELDEQTKNRVYHEAVDMIKTLSEDESAPVVMTELMKAMEKYIEINKGYKIAKDNYNQILLQRERQFIEKVDQSEDPLLFAAKYAMTGNYIDFGAMDDVNEEKLNELLEKCEKVAIDQIEFENLRSELQTAHNMVYITDNAGEIVLDKVFIRTIKKIYPNIKITIMVRDQPILNDATMDDAMAVGMDEVGCLMTNGSDIPGTPMHRISQEAKETIKKADFCIAKGQGNFETMSGCGENIYYLFLCKCDLFVEKFNMHRFAPVIKNEQR